MNSTAPYDLGASFEQSLVHALCTSRKLFNRIGKEVNPDLLGTSEGQLLVIACRLFTAENSRPPDSKVTVLEKLHDMRRKGRVSEDQIRACQAYLDTAEVVTDENLLSQVVPVLQERLRLEALIENTKLAGTGAPLDKVVALEERAKKLDRTNVDDGSANLLLDTDSLRAEVKRLRTVDRLKLGNYEIDSVVGGLSRGYSALTMSQTGCGKSMMVCQQAAVATAQGLTTTIATTETSPSIIKLRYVAALTGLLIDEIEAWAVQDDMTHDTLIRTAMAEAGRLSVGYFTPDATTVQEILNWVQDTEQQHSLGVDVLLVDMGDHLTTGDKNHSSYDVGGYVQKALRSWASENAKWVLNTSHLQRSTGVGNRVASNENVADSLHKVRVPDLVMILNLTEAREVIIEVTKNRDGNPCRVGPLPNAFATGCAVHSEFLADWRQKLVA